MTRPTTRRVPVTLVSLQASIALLACSTTAAEVPAGRSPSDQEQRAALPKLQREDVFELEHASDPEVAPDGEAVVYVRRSNDILTDKTRSSLWLAAMDGSGQRPLVTGAGDASQPRWSPGGDRLAYLMSNAGESQIHVRWMKSGADAAVTSVRESPASLCWSPDGKWIAFTMQVPAEVKPLVKAPKKPEGAEWADEARVIDTLRYRWDGRGFLEAAYSHVFVVPADGGTPRQLTSGAAHHEGPLAWTPDGTRLVFSANRHEDWERQTIESDLYAVAVVDGVLTRLTQEPGRESQARFSPDGAHMLFLTQENRPEPYVTQRLEVVEVASDGTIDPTTRRIMLRDLDRSIAAARWLTHDTLVVQYDDRGRRVLDSVGLDGRHARLTSEVGGTSTGRPYISGDFDAGPGGSLVFTRGSASRPADLVTLVDGRVRQLTALNEDLLDAHALGELREIEFESSHDGQVIQAWYVLPPDFEPGRKYPMILELHGGPHSAYGPNFSVEMQLFAAAGYIVFYDNYRGSSSYGEDFAMLLKYRYSSSEDAADHLSGVDAMIALGFVDADQLFVTGGSAGGIATAYLVGLSDRFRAAVAAKPVINWVSKTLTGDISFYQIRHQFPGMPWEEPDHYWQRSPLSLVGNVTTPTMLMTGEEDYRTPISEAEQFYVALKLRGIDSVFVRLPGSSHGIANRPSRLISKVDHILAWFARYRTDLPQIEESR